MINIKVINKILLNIKVFLRIKFNVITNNNNNNNNNIEGIVFSKDRPIQLFSLLESYYRYCEDEVPIHILYKASNQDYKNGYKEIENYFRQREESFIDEEI